MPFELTKQRLDLSRTWRTNSSWRKRRSSMEDLMDQGVTHPGILATGMGNQPLTSITQVIPGDSCLVSDTGATTLMQHVFVLTLWQQLCSRGLFQSCFSQPSFFEPPGFFFFSGALVVWAQTGEVTGSICSGRADRARPWGPWPSRSKICFCFP